MPYLQLDGLTKRFGDFLAVDRVTLDLERGQILALLGPSGSGKTTTLRLLAGFETPDAGRIIVDGEDVTRTAPVGRRFGMVFQHYALFPHLDVGENVAFGLESLGIRGSELTRRVSEALGQVDLAGFEDRRVTELSGGQQQRVALARALAPQPRVLLLDEPLSNLDPSLRERTRREIRAVINRMGITTVIVTHEQEEAFDLGDRVAVLRAGRVEQEGAPDDLYGAPVNAFVAGFVGRASAVPAEVIGTGADGTRVRIEGGEWLVQEPWPPAGSPASDGSLQAMLMVRPEALRFTKLAPGVLAGTVVERRFTGALAFYTLETDGGIPLEVSARPDAARIGERIGLAPADRGVHLFRGDGE
ncbi:MAG: ABC transporter ATP-binding protein [Gemmatimonadota bacterium]